MIKLQHYSRVPGLKTLDPNFQGTGAKGAENKHGVPDVKVTYFYREGSEPEDVVTSGANTLYTVHADDSKIYDIGKDPRGIIKRLREASQDRQVNPGSVTRDEMLGAVRDAGFHGFHNSNSPLAHAVGMFHPTKPASEQDLTGLKVNKSMKKSRSDEGKTPDQKAAARGERNVRHTSIAIPGGDKSIDHHERRDIEAGHAPGRKGVWVGSDSPVEGGVHRVKGTFTKPKAKAREMAYKVHNEAYKIKPKLTKDEADDMPGEELDKSKNVREQKKKVFGTQSSPTNPEMREKHMTHIRDFVKRRYGIDMHASGGKIDEKTGERRDDSPEEGVDKPDWRSGNLEAQQNPDAMIHELGHLETLPEGMDLPEGQRHMDRQYADVQKEHGYMKQKRSQGEVQPMAMENPIRRRAGLPAARQSVPVKPGDGPRTAVDTGEVIGTRVPKGDKQVDLIRQSRNMSPENRDRQQQIDEGVLTWSDSGWQPGKTPDAKINARKMMQDQGASPMDANKIATGAPEAAPKMPEKMAASEGHEIDDATLRQMVKERFGMDIPETPQVDHERIMRLAEGYAHGSARKPIAQKMEAPDEAALPDLEKEPGDGEFIEKAGEFGSVKVIADPVTPIGSVTVK